MIDLFLLPALNGLCFAILLPILGCYLRLRDEWLAALAYPHVAAAGALAGLALGVPLAAGGLTAAIGAAVVKRGLQARVASHAAFALLLLGGWAAAILLTANLPVAERLGHALFDGQLYFTGAGQIGYSATVAALGLLILRNLSVACLRARIFPDLRRSDRLVAWGLGLGFDLLSAVALAAATMTMGVMGAFALIFVPSWAAFGLARDWRRAVGLALALGVLAYGIAFATALHWDQTFGPLLALVSIVMGAAVTARARIARWQGKC